MANVGNLNVILRLNQGPFNKGMRNASLKAKGFGGTVKEGSKIAQVALGNLAARAAVAVPAAFGKLLAAGRDFAAAMKNSTAIMGDLSDAMRSDMANAAQDVAKVTQFSAKEAAEAYFFLASAGLDAQQSVAALPATAKFAQAGMFDLSTATDLLTDAQSALGLTVKDAAENLENMTRVSDVLVKANTLANASVEQFSKALTTKAGAALRIVNKDIEEGVAVLSAFADQGIKGEQAGTALNIVLRDLQTKAIKNKAAFRELGVEVFDSSGKMNNIADIVEDLENKIGSMNAEQKKATLLQLGFSDKSVVFTQSLLGMSEKIRQYEKDLRMAGGTTDKVANKQLTEFAKGQEKLAAAIEKAGIKLNEAFGDDFGALMTSAGKLLDSFIDDFIVGVKVLEIGANRIKAAFLRTQAVIAEFRGDTSQFEVSLPQSDPTLEPRTAFVERKTADVLREQARELDAAVPKLGQELRKLVEEAQGKSAQGKSRGGTGRQLSFRSLEPGRGNLNELIKSSQGQEQTNERILQEIKKQNRNRLAIADL